jgi:hypothetical protein
MLGDVEEVVLEVLDIHEDIDRWERYPFAPL